MRVSVVWGAKCLFLLETARGVILHSQGEQVRPFARWEPRKHFESLREKNHGESIPGNSRAVDESRMMEHRELLVKPAISPFAPMSEQEDMTEILHQSDWKESAQEVRARRVLQTSCDEGESFAIASTLLPEVVGCYNDTGTEAKDEVFYTETGAVGPGQNIVQAFDVEGDDDIRWLVAFEASPDTTSIEENVPYCFSPDRAADVHPADVTSWFCFTNSPDEAELVSPEEFSTSCGCSSTSNSSTIAPSPSRVSPTLAPSAASRDIVSSASPTAASRDIVLTASPTAASRDIVSTASPTAGSRGIVSTASPTAGSRGIVSSASPSTALSMPPTGSMTFTETTSPSPGPGSSSPTSTPTSADTCDGEFMVTSSAVPLLEGCFQDAATGGTTSTTNGELIYTNFQGSSDEGMVVVAAPEYDNFEPSFSWLMSFIGTNTSNANATIYCVSQQMADEVHPADATWLCNLNGITFEAAETADFVEVSDTDLAATCECSGMTPAPLNSPGDEQEQPSFGHRSIMLSTFVTVAVSFAATVVHLVGL